MLKHLVHLLSNICFLCVLLDHLISFDLKCETFRGEMSRLRSVLLYVCLINKYK